MSSLRAFENAIKDTITRTLRETTYKPTQFMDMVQRNGAFDTCITLVRTEPPSEGFAKLWEMKRLDLTAEAQMIRPEFASVIPEEDVARAKKRLKAYEYEVGGR